MLSLRYKRFEAYAGLPQHVVKENIITAYENEQIPYRERKAPPHMMYDIEHEQIILASDGVECSLIYVSNDPFTRLFQSILGTSTRTGGITLVSAKYQNRCELQTVMSYIHEDVWRIRQHHRFQFALLLELLNKQKWKRLQRGGSS
ncbi:hypothetical protein [Geomicrobium sp. JCM 19038]|uniref:hypothetical protein n=1 Tax=Geomicrobium sp. JCM 19038 TaxID=1460635 RepID=UPI00045F23D5|nr:hypothetical protein [Geomicrobium sp. JCM 19038]GAK09044.1 hypothetical protein JCM19038_2857 [Geomicrobium sp. JCM 19038]